jgi:hypothetical protein
MTALAAMSDNIVMQLWINIHQNLGPADCPGMFS